MIAVATVGAVTAMGVHDARTTRRRAALYRVMMNHAVLAGAYRGEPVGCTFTDEQARVLKAHSAKSDPEMAAYHDSLRRKYRDAREHPWRAVAPDPPPPR
jgi:hypothetical protein